MKLVIIIACLMEMGLALHYMRLFFLRVPKVFWPHLCMMSAMLIYCAGGTLLAYTSMPQESLDQILLWRHIGDVNILGALAIAGFFALFVDWLAMRLPQCASIPTNLLMAALDRVSLNPLTFTLTSGVILGGFAALAATGRVSFHGGQTADNAASTVDPGHADPLLMIAQQALSLLPLLCGYRLLVKGKLWFTLPVVLATAGFALTEGRQQLVILLFIFLAGVAMNRQVKITKAITATLIASILGLALLGFFVSVAVRMATWYSPRSASGAQVATLAFQMLLNGGQDEKTNVAAQTKDNVDVRAFNPIEFLASLTSADRDHSGAMGDVLVNGFVNAVPSALWRQKELYHKEEEEIASATFNVPIAYDEAETVMSGGYNDFREPGVLIYAMLLLLLFGFLFFLIKQQRFALFRLLSVSALLFTVLEPETATVSWFLLLRSVFVLYLLDFVLQMFIVNERQLQIYRQTPSGLLAERMTPSSKLR